jgi:hypothetical protein
MCVFPMRAPGYCNTLYGSVIRHHLSPIKIFQAAISPSRYASFCNGM